MAGQCNTILPSNSRIAPTAPLRINAWKQVARIALRLLAPVERQHFNLGSEFLDCREVVPHEHR